MDGENMSAAGAQSLVRRHIDNMRKIDIVFIVVIIIVVPSLLLLSFDDGMTGLVVADRGCCLSSCMESSRASCSGEFELRSCPLVAQCMVGCCIDSEGYCLSSYLKGRCDEGNGMFIARHECGDEPLCVWTRPVGSLLGSTGYPINYPLSQKGVVFVDPNSGNIGTAFTIRMEVFDKQQVRSVEAKIEGGEFTDMLSLYDDGQHGDGNPSDGVFGAVWGGSSSAISEIKKINVTGIVDGVESLPGNYFILTPTNCIPLKKDWEDSRRDMIFAEFNPSARTMLKNNAQRLIEQIYIVSSFSGIGETNIYVFDQRITKNDQVQVATQVKQACGFYDNTQDFTVLFDNTYDYCEQDRDFIRVNPLVFLNRSLMDEDIDFFVFLKEFCQHTKTGKQLVNGLVDAVIAPNVTIISPLGPIIVSTEQIPLTFLADDNRDDNISYVVYSDIRHPLTILSEGQAPRGQLATVPINLTDGTHTIWVEVTDSDNNFGHSELQQINANSSNFVIDILSLDPLFYNTSPDVEFTISHGTDKELKYTIIVDDETAIKGMANVDKKMVVKMQLHNGTHTIEVAARDAHGRIAYSFPYDIIIGENDAN